jgi:hypothetical protein
MEQKNKNKKKLFLGKGRLLLTALLMFMMRAMS